MNISNVKQLIKELQEFNKNNVTVYKGVKITTQYNFAAIGTSNFCYHHIYVANKQSQQLLNVNLTTEALFELKKAMALLDETVLEDLCE